MTLNEKVIDKLLTKNFVFICIANFMSSFSFYLLMPTLPFYLIDNLNTNNTMVGFVLSCFTIAVLFVRPFSGFLADTFSRRPIYLIAYFLFSSIFVGYLLAGTLTLFIMFRIFHGFAFGTLSTTGNTLVIDIMPASRRGEGLGYYGVTSNLAMATGPMVGLLLKDNVDFDWIFLSSIFSGIIGFFFAYLVKAPKKFCQKKLPLSLDRFFLIKGIPAGIVFAFIAVPYAITTSYIALSAQEYGMKTNSGIFFSIMAVGMILSRVTSGKRVDKGYIIQGITKGIALSLCGFIGEVFLEPTFLWDQTVGTVLFYVIPIFIGYGYGTIFPALNSLFLNLAHNNRRATANSTYLTSWDIGMGAGVYLGGYLSEIRGFSFSYLAGTLLALLSFGIFVRIVIPHFNKNKLR